MSLIRFASTLTLCLMLSQQAFAHAHPKTQVPAADAVVSAPAEVSIVFSETLEPAFSKISVSDAQGRMLATGKAELDAATHKRLSVVLPALAPGVYEVHWVAVSVDGHRTEGRYRFSVK